MRIEILGEYKDKRTRQEKVSEKERKKIRKIALYEIME